MTLDLADAHASVTTRAALVSRGITYSSISHALRRGRWQAVGRAIVLHNGSLTADELRWSAVLSHADPCAIAGPTAAALYGLRGFESRRTHVVVPDHARVCMIPDVVVHRSRRFSEVDMTWVAGLPVVTRERAIADSAALESDVRRSCGLVAAAVQQRVVVAKRLRTEIDFVQRRRHRHALRMTVADILGGADSLAEIDFTRLSRRAGLPAPLRQTVRTDANGRRRYVDADFDRFCVEVDGALHQRQRDYWADMSRQNYLVIGGDRILRFPTVAIRHAEEEVIRQLQLAWTAFAA